MTDLLAFYEKTQKESREHVLRHLDDIGQFDELQIAQLLGDVLDDPARVLSDLVEMVQKARRDTLNVCFPGKTEACAPDPEEIPPVSQYDDRTEHTGADGKPIMMDMDTHWTIEVMNDATEER